MDERVDKLEEEFKKLKKENKMIKKILKCIFEGNQDCEEVEQKLKQANEKIKSLESANKQLLTNQKALEITINKYQEEINTLNTTISKLQENKLIIIKNLYENLSSATKDGIKNIFSGGDEYSLFGSCAINFDDIWEYAKELNNEHKDDDFDTLKKILEVVFETIKENKKYSILEISQKDNFDIDKMTRDNRSNSQDGKVKEIILFGYTKKDKIIKKPIVRITE